MADSAARFPTKSDRLGAELVELIRTDLRRIGNTDDEWTAASLSLAEHLSEARDQHPSDNKFGDWLALHQIRISGHDRAALLHMARDLPLARKVLERTKRKSYKHIWLQEMKPRSVHVDKAVNGAGAAPEGMKSCSVHVDRAPDGEGIEVKPIRNDGTLGKRRTKTSGKLVQESSSSRFSDARADDRQPTSEYAPLDLMCVNLREMREGFKRAEAGYRGFEHARKNLVNDPRESIAIHAVKHDLERIGLFIEELWPFISKFLPEGAQAGPQTASGLLTINHER
jgi:hypothetical protein